MMKQLILLAALVLMTAPAAADGLELKNGRYDGMVTVLTLTDDQIDALTKSRDLSLTKEQRRLLGKIIAAPPTTLFVYFTMDGENDCTCQAANLGLRFSKREIEVPHDFLMSDKEAARLEIE